MKIPSPPSPFYFLSQIKSLPFEILASIISFCAPDPHPSHPNITLVEVAIGTLKSNIADVLRSKKFQTVTISQDIGSRELHIFPLNVSHVCRSWQAISLAHPAWWSTIVLGDIPGCLYGENVDSRMITFRRHQITKVVKLYLQRSGNAPLSIQIDAVEDDTYREDFVRLLVAQCRRWSRLDLTCGANDWVQRLEIHGKLPILEELVLSMDEQYHTASVFEQSPRLRRITLLDCFIPNLPNESLQIDWDQIEVLHSHCTAMDSNSPAVYVTRKLKHFILTHPQPWCMEPEALRQALRRESVEHFTVDQGLVDDSGIQRASLEEIFETFVFPSLRVLELKTPLPEWPPWDKVSAFLKPCAMLQRLVLSDVTLAKQDIFHLLQQTASLTSLEIRDLKPEDHDEWSVDALYGFLTYSPGIDHHTPLPRLEDFTFAFGDLPTTPAVIAMIMSRRTPMFLSSSNPPDVTPLQSVSLTFLESMTSNSFIDDLWRLRRDGLRLYYYLLSHSDTVAMEFPSPPQPWSPWNYRSQ